MQKYKTREEWLLAALALIKPHFAQCGYPTFPEVRVSCGWPSSRGTSQKKRCIGEAWSADAAADGIIQIFISPWLGEPASEQGVLATLVHEFVHAVVGNKEKHNKVFGKCARAVGLAGKLTATIAGPELLKAFEESWMPCLGEYPHGKLDLTKSPKPKQSTRMIKMECGQCGYVCRTSQKWLDDIGPAHCPQHGEMAVDKPADAGEDDSDND